MLWTALLLGLAGSLHCAGMCGPLALALPATGGGKVGFLAGRLAYNAGRLVTYAALGLVAGLVGGAFALAGLQRWISLAAGGLILCGLLFASRVGAATPAVHAVAWVKSRLAGLLRRRSLRTLGLLGMLNGILPCGLVYAACAGATTTSGPLAGAGYMALFGLGTVPMMLAVALAGWALPMAWRLRLQGFVPAVTALVAVLLIVRGLALGIPWLSPAPMSGAACH